MRKLEAIFIIQVSASVTCAWALAQEPSGSSPATRILIQLREPKAQDTCPETTKTAPEPSDCDPQLTQEKVLSKHLMDLGAEHVEYYPEANMVRTEISASTLDAVKADVTVASVYPIDPVRDEAAKALTAAGSGTTDQAYSPMKRYSIGPMGQTEPSFFGNPFASISTSNFPFQCYRYPGGMTTLGTPGFPMNGSTQGQFAIQNRQQFSGVLAGSPMTGATAMNGTPMNGAAHFGVANGFGGSFGGRGLVGIIGGLVGDLAMSVLSSRGGMSGMMAGFAGNAALNYLSSRNSGLSCKISLSEESATFPAAGGTGFMKIRAPKDCVWEAKSDGDWIQIKAGARGAGSNTVTYTVAVLPDHDARSGSISIDAVQGMIPVTGKTRHMIEQSVTDDAK